jgi:serine/threonine-protein kinase
MRDLLPAFVAALAERYTVEGELGAGGMATVYRAVDRKHGRRVAIKVLRPELGAVLGVDRFLAEIQVTAALQHPNLLPLFDSGEAAGLLFYVMPFVDGESLRDRLARERQLPVDDAVRIAATLGSALHHAHEQGVIHRDLKPENVLLQNGLPLIADFGIALAVRNAGGARVTQTGLSLGTPQYMSPEQAAGDRALDARSDVYSLAAITYEMLTGEPPHTGPSAPAIIAKLMTEAPRAASQLRRTVPAGVDAAVARGLEKLPADRFATAQAFADALRAGGTTLPRGSQPGPWSRARPREWIAWGVAVAAGAVAATGWLRRGPRPPADDPPVAQFRIAFPDTLEVPTLTSGSRVAITPDGRVLAFVLRPRGGQRMIFVRPADTEELTPVPGTGEAQGVAFSPDGRSVVFTHATGRVTVAPVAGGATRDIAPFDPDDPIFHALWPEPDRIVFRQGGALWEMRADGSGRRRIAGADSAAGINRVGSLAVLPGGTHGIVTAWPDLLDQTARLFVVSLVDGALTPLDVPGARPHYDARGFLVWVDPAGSVVAAGFDARRRVLTTAPEQIVALVQANNSVDIPDLAVSATGALVFRSGTALSPRAIVSVDRSGRDAVVPAPPRRFVEPDVSPDGTRLVVGVSNGNFFTGDLWLVELAGGATSPLTTDGHSWRPRWAPDGRRIYHLDGLALASRVVSRPWDATGAPTVHLERRQLAEIAPGPRGGMSAIRTLDGPRDIYIAPTDSLSALRPFVVGPANETDVQVSPDGRWLSYQSDEGGATEVYVRPLPGPGARVPVSIGGGIQARWDPDGRTLYYRGPTHLMAASFGEGADRRVVRRDTLFADRYARIGEGQKFAVLPGGRGFVFLKGDDGAVGSTRVILGWWRLVGATPAAGAR